MFWLTYQLFSCSTFVNTFVNTYAHAFLLDTSTSNNVDTIVWPHLYQNKSIWNVRGGAVILYWFFYLHLYLFIRLTSYIIVYFHFHFGCLSNIFNPLLCFPVGRIMTSVVVLGSIVSKPVAELIELPTILSYSLSRRNWFMQLTFRKKNSMFRSSNHVVIS